MYSIQVNNAEITKEGIFVKIQQITKCVILLLLNIGITLSSNQYVLIKYHLVLTKINDNIVNFSPLISRAGVLHGPSDHADLRHRVQSRM